jgi:phage shock protein A
MMNLLDRLKLLVESSVNAAAENALEVGRNAAARATKPSADKLLGQADKRLAKLRDDLAASLAREKKAEQKWHDALSASRKLDDEVDLFLREEKNEEARAKLAQSKKLQAEATRFEREMQRHAAFSARLEQEIDELDRQLNAIRERIAPSKEPTANTPETTATKTNASAPAVVEKKSDENAQTPNQATDTSRMADLLRKAKE